MFCPKCGKQVTESLKYCNGCGERLAKDDDDSPGKMLDGILETLFWTAMLGLGLLIGLVAVLLNKGVTAELVGLIIFGYLATIFGICFYLAKQVPKLIDAKLKAFEGSSETPPQQAQLSAPTTAQLEEYREPAISVVDNTTRSLDRVPLAKN